MKEKFPFVTAAFGFVVLLGLSYASWVRTGVLPSNSNTNAQPDALYAVIPVSEDTAYSRMRGEYPQFSEASDAFNGGIREFIRAQMIAHATESEENWKSRVATARPGEDTPEFPAEGQTLDFSVRWTPEQVNDRYISFVMRYGGYTGGAHGYEDIRTFNYDVAGRRELALADLFPNGSDYLTTISEFSRVKLRDRLLEAGGTELVDASSAMLEMGTQPIEENFANFTFNDSQIVFYFGQYQVAPYAAGEQTVIMSRR
jgi:hypothetical protein